MAADPKEAPNKSAASHDHPDSGAVHLRGLIQRFPKKGYS